MTSESSPSPSGDISSTATGDGGNSNCQRTPWSQVVRGVVEPEAIAPRSLSASPPCVVPVRETAAAVIETQPECSEGSDNGNVSGAVKSVWSKPSVNGVVEGSMTPVMGAASWPALSESTKPVPKSLSYSSDSSSADVSVISSQAPVNSQPPQKHVKSDANHRSNQNHSQPVRQKSMKRGGNAGGAYTRPPIRPPTPPPMPTYPLFDLSYRGFVPPAMDPAVLMGGSHSQIVNDHPSNRKRNNFVPRPRGDGGMYVNNGRGGRHDREWRGPRSNRDNAHQRAPPPPPPPPFMGFMQPAHIGSQPFIAPQSIRPYGAPIGYDMPPPFVYVPTISPESYTGPPVFPRAPPPSVYVPVMEPLSVLIQRQIEYYFSDANLVKDNYLRSNMDEEGWVPVSLIAGFHRVQSLTSDIQMILSCLTDSAIVEVQGETLRRRDDWRKWVNRSTNTDSGSQTPHSVVDDGSVIEISLQKLTVDELTTIENNNTRNKEGALDIPSSGLTGSLNPANGEASTINL